METATFDSSTRERILLTLKKKGGMSVDDLSREMNITPMGVRQHLLILEKNGVVEYVTKRHGVGRPGFLYRLTDTADDLFPKTYGKFAMEILADIEKNEGKEKIAEIFRRRKERISVETARTLSGRNTVSDRLRLFSEILKKDGYIIGIDEADKHLTLNVFNCPISRIAARFIDACHYDLQLFREILGEDVLQKQCLADGAKTCIYVIPKKRRTRYLSASRLPLRTQADSPGRKDFPD